MVVGFDLGTYSVQISYYRSGMEAPQTAEQVIGSEVFNIPMVLCKRPGVNQWFYGRDALKHHERGEGYLVDGLLQKAIDQEYEVIEGERFEGIALLTLFIKRALSILGGSRVSGSVSDIMFTCKNLGPEVIDVMSRVSEGLQLKNCNIYFQSYSESIYHYMIHQAPELWRDNVLVSYYDGTDITDYVFSRNLKTSPTVAFVDESAPYRMPMPQIVTEDARPAAYAKLDAVFSDHVKEVLSGASFSGIYLLGDGFKDQWYNNAVKIMAHNRRLFAGNDLFSRGAAFCLEDKYEPCNASKEHVFLGVDKLRSNIGIEVLRRGKKSYLALLDAGINWYDVKCEYELFLPENGVLPFVVIPLDGGEHIIKEIELYDIPDRDPDTLRIKLNMSMSDVNTVKVHIEDLGFGDIFPSSGLKWDYVVEIGRD
ncbi:MAG: hypothetical protein K6G12_00765 [Lachnospiraceae bacterium]|nr:hypothetical protein [Lachnospiraceae bacterium]